LAQEGGVPWLARLINVGMLCWPTNVSTPATGPVSVFDERAPFYKIHAVEFSRNDHDTRTSVLETEQKEWSFYTDFLRDILPLFWEEFTPFLRHKVFIIERQS
jgi:hypothetical protein